MEVHLSPELQAKVERAAAENKSGAEEYVKQLVEHYVDHPPSLDPSFSSEPVLAAG